MSNLQLVSEWYPRDQLPAVLAQLKPGDLLEFNRGSYCHWAIYIGELQIDLGSEMSVKPMVIHRANPADQINAARGIPSSLSLNSISGSVSGGTDGLKEVSLETLEDVWRTSVARINNSYDEKSDPYRPSEIVERAFSYVYKSQSANYNLLSNNCEHFATWARNGLGISHQVSRAMAGVKTLGVMAATAFVMPKAVSVSSGLALLAYQSMQQVRRRQPNPRLE